MSNIFNMTDVWNAAGTVFTAVKMNVTDTASDPNSLLMDLQVGGNSKFSVSKFGNITVPNGGGIIDVTGSRLLLRTDLGLSLANGLAINFSANNVQVPDLVVLRDAANTLAQRNGTNAQTFNLYNSYTDASNYSRLSFRSDASNYYIETQYGGTGSYKPLTIRSYSGIINLDDGNSVFTLASGSANFNGRMLYSVWGLRGNPTWNNSATTFTGYQLNVTDTASDPASLLMDLQVGGVSKFNVRKDGLLTAPFAVFSSFINVPNLYITNNAGAVTWGSANDVVLTRDFANILAQRNGTAAQTFNLYNSYTDASNYSRLKFYSSGSVNYIAPEAAGTGTSYGLVVAAGSGAVANTLYLRPASSTGGWTINGSSHLYAETDNAFDIGASGFGRPRNLYVAGTGNFGGNMSVTGALLSYAYISNLSDTGSITIGNSSDVRLNRDAANVLAQRNGTNAQTFNVYNTYTDASNYERGGLSWSGDVVFLQTGAAGTGQRRPMAYNALYHSIYVSDGLKWQFDINGQFIAYTDNANDIGVVGNAPRYIRASSAIQTKALTVATLPAAATALAGARSFVTDATVATFGSTAVGGGANAVPVWTDGTTWKIG